MSMKSVIKALEDIDRWEFETTLNGAMLSATSKTLTDKLTGTVLQLLIYHSIDVQHMTINGVACQELKEYFNSCIQRKDAIIMDKQEADRREKLSEVLQKFEEKNSKIRDLL